VSTTEERRVRELWERAGRVLPGSVNSNTRLLGPPMVIERGKGSRIWDVDGNEYIDHLLGQGPAFLGHACEPVLQAVERACRDGIIFAATHPGEIEAAELLRDVLGWPERIRLGSSSTEMVQAALRVARAATGRRRVVLFRGHYHGWLDNVLMSASDRSPTAVSAGQPQEALADVLLLPWNDASALEEAFAQHGDEIAAVIMEPMMINAGVVLPLPGYLETARRITRVAGSLLVFDETISGFRVALGGAAQRFGVTPDLAIYGKAMAAGWPASALAGSDAVMSLFADGRVGHFGTFNGNMVASAAIIAGLGLLVEGDPYPRIDALGTRLMGGIRERAEAQGLDVHVQGLPMAFHVSMPARDRAITTFAELETIDRQRYEQLVGDLLAEGVWVARRGVWYVSAAHGEADVDEVLERIDRAMARSSARRTATVGA
jgi:glutamate-1-semialdehyde 2,1-aminomutase